MVDIDKMLTKMGYQETPNGIPITFEELEEFSKAIMKEAQKELIAKIESEVFLFENCDSEDLQMIPKSNWEILQFTEGLKEPEVVESDE